MDYDEVFLQVLDLLQREKRLSYRVLKRRFGLDDNDLEDLKEDLIYAKQLAVDEDGRVLVWTGRLRGDATARIARQGMPWTRLRSLTRPHTSPKRFWHPAPPSKASASRSPFCSPTSKTPPS